MIDGTQIIDYHGHVGRWDPLGMEDDPKNDAPRYGFRRY